MNIVVHQYLSKLFMIFRKRVFLYRYESERSQCFKYSFSSLLQVHLLMIQVRYMILSVSQVSLTHLYDLLCFLLFIPSYIADLNSYDPDHKYQILSNTPSTICFYQQKILLGQISTKNRGQTLTRVGCRTDHLH